jgi:2-iminobutanoate/2-iminopropanoate deaminase
MAQTYGPYTPIRKAGDVYFISGQIGVEPETKEAPLEIRLQTTQALNNLVNVLASESLTASDVVKVNIYLTNMDDFATVNEVYGTFFSDPKPARTTLAVKELPRVAGDTTLLIEIEAVAYKQTEDGSAST